MSLPRRALIAAVLLLPGLVLAEMQAVDDLYLGEVEVTSRSAADRRDGVRDALIQVLVRITGDVSISLDAGATPLTQSAERFMRSYRYQDWPADTPDDPARTGLLVRFDPGAVNQALKQQGLPIWAQRRADTLVWMTGPTPQSTRALLNPSQISEFYPGLRDAARRRGLPLSLPAMDVQDQSAVSYSDLLTQNATAIRQASQRYRPHHILLLRLRDNNGAWLAHWSLLQGQTEEPLRWRSTGDSADGALNAGFDQLADTLAQRYAIRIAAGWVQRTRLEVVGVRELNDYARVVQHLRDLPAVDSVQPAAAVGEELHFDVSFEGTTEELERSLRLGGLLQEASRAPAFSPQTPDANGQDTGLSFFAVRSAPVLRFRYLP